MDYARLGSTGLKVSRLCLGMMSFGDPSLLDWAVSEADAEPLIAAAVDAGVNFFDTADMYTNGACEEITGRILSKLFAKRDDYVLATKVFFPAGSEGPNDSGLSRKHIFAAINDSLRRLGTDYIDLYQIHRFDPETPIEETMEALNDLVRSGKVRYIGASLMHAWEFAKMQRIAEVNGWTRFVSMQSRYNLINREDERELNPMCVDMGVGLIPYSPLARGLLAGTRVRSGERLTVRGGGPTRYERPEDYDVQEAAFSVAERLGVSAAQVATAWVRQQQGITAPITGATKLAHIHDAVASLELKLDDESLAELEAPYLPRLLSDLG